MQRRVAKVNISAAGGTAASGSKTCKVSLPNSLISKIGIDDEVREVELTFDGNQIVISRRFKGVEFARRKLDLGHDVRLLRYFDCDTLCTVIYADFTDRTLAVESFSDDPVKTAFGNNTLPTWVDFLSFLEDRCIPRRRAGLREYLDAIGVGEYDPLDIILKTAGRMAEDSHWLEVEAL